MTTATTDPADIGKRVKKLRISRGWTQADLADKADIASDTVWMIETGRARPRDLTVAALARAFDVDLAELLGEEGLT